MTIPYDRPKTLYNASSYLKPGIRLLLKICHIEATRSGIPARNSQEATHNSDQ